MTVTEAFNIFKSELELPDRKQKETASAQQQMRSEIAKHIYLSNSLLIGSYSRYTKINPLNDIDALLVRNDRRVRLSTDGSGTYPGQALDQVANAAQRAYPRSTIKKQSRSVNIQLYEHQFGFDLIPAWLRDPDGYWIPDVDTGNWLPTNPEAHNDLLTCANKQSMDMLKPVIKMVKNWSRHNLDLLRSFHIELICVDIFQSRDITSYQLGVATALVCLGNYVGKPMLDPIYGCSRVDKPLGVDELRNLGTRVRYDAENSIEALRLEIAGNQEAAIRKWKGIFLSGFPK